MDKWLNQIIEGDCLEVMKEIPDKSVDLVVTDPPYKLTSGGCRGGLNITFNQTDQKGKESGEMFEIPKFEEWFPEVYRVLKDGSHFYCMCNDKHLENILKTGRENNFKELNVLVWDKGMHTPLGYYMKNIEFIVLFRKGYAKKINNMGSKALIGIVGKRGNKIHPSEKPKELIEHLLLNSTKETEIVLDPFIGSGTTAIAALNTGRFFIGIEKEPKYCEIARKRLEQAQMQQRLFAEA